MTDQQLETEIRAAFDTRHVESLGLEHHVFDAIPWERPAQRRFSAPRLAGAFVAVLAVALIAILVAPTILSRLGIYVPGGLGAEAPAYSVGAVSGDSVFIVQRTSTNVLLQSTDGGRSWIERLQFPGIFSGMQILGDAGFVWSIDMGTFGPCTPPCPQPSESMTLYRTSDGGVHWTALPQTDFAVEDAYFLDSTHGWADSPHIGPGSGDLYQTVDGGTTWSRAGSLPTDAPMGYVYGVGNHPVTFTKDGHGVVRGWYIGGTRLWTTSDGGRSWAPVSFPVPATVAGFTTTAQQPAIDDRGATVAIAYRDPKGPDNATPNSIYLYVSSDGGATWADPRPAPRGFGPVGDILTVTMLDSSNVWLTSQSPSAGDNVQAAPAIAYTANAGKQWQVFPKTPQILQAVFVDPLRGYALAVAGPYDTNEIVRTEDAGKTWQLLNVPVFPVKK